jgi:hypothetical protein
MNHSFNELISLREFSKYYDNGLTSRFNALRLKHQLVYGLHCDNPSLQLTLENEIYSYRLVLWTSGDCHIQALEVETGKTMFNRICQFETVEAFFSNYPESITSLFSFDKMK